MTPVLRTLSQAITTASELLSDDTPQGLWMHDLTEAGRPTSNQMINKLVIIPLSLPSGGSGNGTQLPQSNVPGGVSGDVTAVQLRPAAPEEQRYAAELLIRLLGTGSTRQIGSVRHRVAQLPGDEGKITLLGRITCIEIARENL